MPTLQLSNLDYEVAIGGPFATHTAFRDWVEARFAASGWTVTTGTGTDDFTVRSASHPQTAIQFTVRVQAAEFSDRLSFILDMVGGAGEDAAGDGTANPTIHYTTGRQWRWMGNGLQVFLWAMHDEAESTQFYFIAPALPPGSFEERKKQMGYAIMACDSRGTETTLVDGWRDGLPHYGRICQQVSQNVWFSKTDLSWNARDIFWTRTDNRHRLAHSVIHGSPGYVSWGDATGTLRMKGLVWDLLLINSSKWVGMNADTIRSGYLDKVWHAIGPVSLSETASTTDETDGQRLLAVSSI